MDNLPMLSELSDELYVYDNSGERPILGLSYINEDVFISADAADWIKKLSKN